MWNNAFGDGDDFPTVPPYADLEEADEEVEMSESEDHMADADAQLWDPLDESERARMDELEQILEQDLAAFYRVGMALKEIQERRLYRDDYPSFEEFCRDRLDIGHKYAYRKIAAARVMDILSPMGDTLPVPKSERQIRPLLRLEDPVLQVAAWRSAIATHPDQRPTSRDVEAVVREMTVGPSPTPPQDTGQSGEPPEAIYSEDFDRACRALIRVIETEKKNGWKTTTQEAALAWVKRIMRYAKRGD